MTELLNTYLPDVVKYSDRIITSLYETLTMVVVSFAFVVVLGIALGVLLVVESPGNLYENKVLHAIVPKIVNFMRSIPFVVLIAAILPFTRLIVGTGIGVKGAIVPMVIGHVPFFARQVEQALMEVDPGKIEMAHSLGLSRPRIIHSVLLREARSSLIRITTLMAISQVNLSAMAGAVGGGGLGDMAIHYGYERYMPDVAIVTVLALVAIVYIIQGIGNVALKATSHHD